MTDSRKKLYFLLISGLAILIWLLPYNCFAEQEPQTLGVRFLCNGLEFGETSYYGIPISMEGIEPSEEQILSEIQRALREKQEWKPVSFGTVKEDDALNADVIVEYTDTGETLEAEGETVELYNEFVPEDAVRQIAGASVGDTVTVETIAAGSGEERQIRMTLKINAIYQPKELTDELAETLSYGEYHSVETYRASVRDMLLREAIRLNREALEEEAFRQLEPLFEVKEESEEDPDERILDAIADASHLLPDEDTYYLNLMHLADAAGMEPEELEEQWGEEKAYQKVRQYIAMDLVLFNADYPKSGTAK